VNGRYFVASYVSTGSEPFGMDICYDIKDKANAALIAAAPELLEACKESLQYFRQIPEYVDRSVHKSIPITTLERAIAKAEGR
jgi:hypothetical protein